MGQSLDELLSVIQPEPDGFDEGDVTMETLACHLEVAVQVVPSTLLINVWTFGRFQTTQNGAIVELKGHNRLSHTISLTMFVIICNVNETFVTYVY